MIQSFDPEIVIQAGVETSVRDYELFGSPIVGAGFRAEIRQYHWTETTRSQGWSNDSTQLLMFSGAGFSKPTGYIGDSGDGCLSREVGDILMVPKGQKIYSRCRQGDMRALWCLFNPDLLQAFSVIDWSGKRLVEILDIRNAQLRNGMLRIAKEVLKPGLAADAMVEGSLLILLVELSRLFTGTAHGDARATRLSAREIRGITSMIEEKRCSPTLNELAQICGCSRRHLIRAFKQTTGQTLGEHIMEIRLLRSKRLLADRSLQIKEVAYQCGFTGSAAFTAAFRRATGQTPGEYKKEIRLAI